MSHPTAEYIVEARSVDGTCWTDLCLMCGAEGCQDEDGEPYCEVCAEDEDDVREAVAS